MGKGDISITVSLVLSNTGSLPGAQVVQVYTTLPTTSALTHPQAQLKGFKKIFLNPGEKETVEVALDKYAVSYWDDKINTWVVEAGEYAVQVGTSSDDLALTGNFKVAKGFEWNGL